MTSISQFIKRLSQSHSEAESLPDNSAPKARFIDPDFIEKYYNSRPPHVLHIEGKDYIWPPVHGAALSILEDYPPPTGYQDDKIIVSATVDGIRYSPYIILKTDPPVQVYTGYHSNSYGGPSLGGFRPGNWINYVLALGKNLSDEREKKKEKEKTTRFMPVDDSSLFRERL